MNQWGLTIWPAPMTPSFLTSAAPKLGEALKKRTWRVAPSALVRNIEVAISIGVDFCFREEDKQTAL